MSIEKLRHSYTGSPLNQRELHPDPVAQFTAWFESAQAAEQPEVNAMALATADASGRPSVRMMLLKDYDAQGLVFYTNAGSRKAQELTENPQAAVTFYWKAVGRSVRVEGRVELLSREEAERYFRSRPRGSRLGAWASPQSQVISGREVLEQRLRELEATYRDQEIPLPPHWGGHRLIPQVFEFWEGRPDQLHDRFRYVREQTGWRLERLAP